MLNNTISSHTSVSAPSLSWGTGGMTTSSQVSSLVPRVASSGQPSAPFGRKGTISKRELPDDVKRTQAIEATDLIHRAYLESSMKDAEKFSVPESHFVGYCSRVFNTTAETLDTAAAREAMLTLAGTDILAPTPGLPHWHFNTSVEQRQSLRNTADELGGFRKVNEAVSDAVRQRSTDLAASSSMGGRFESTMYGMAGIAAAAAAFAL